MKTGAQEHFYMETQATLAIPREDKEMELFGNLLFLNHISVYASNFESHFFKMV